MIDLKCKICGEKFENGHPYKFHQINLKTYIETYESRKDKLTGEKIEFKGNLENYYLTDFSNKNNLKKYLKESTPEIAKEYCKEFLQQRKKIKELKYAPTQVELRSILAPTIITFDKLFENEGGYYGLCEGLGFENKFKILKDKIESPPENFVKNNTIFVDSREQRHLKLNTNIEIKKLQVGDYGIENSNIYVERKSLSDWISTTSTGFERFKREIQRAKDNGFFIIVLVENSISAALSFNYLPYIARNTKASPDFIWSRTRELLQSFDNLQYLFVDGRESAARMVEKVFFSGHDFKKFDLQAAADMKLI